MTRAIYILFFLAVAIVILLFICLIVFNLVQFGKLPDYKTNNKILKSKQFNGKAFVNADVSNLMKLDIKKVLKIYKSFITVKAIKRPPQDVILCSDAQIWKELKSKEGVSVTWFGHSSVMVDIDGKRLLFDPVFANYASPFKGSVKRFENAFHLDKDDFEKFGKIDALIISHDHFDHLDHYAIKRLKDYVFRFIVPLGVADHLIRWGIDADRIIEMDWMEECTLKDLRFICTPSQHFSGRNPFRQNSSLWCSWTIVGQAGRLFFSGDSGYFKGFKEIGEKYGPFNLAMIECGQYNDMWHDIHMMPEETAKAGIDLNAMLVLPIHNSAFSLSVHSWNEPLKRFYSACEKSDINTLKVLQGETYRVQ